MRITKNSSYALLGMSVSILFIILWSLNKGLGLLDEAFYLLHLKEGVKYYALSSWPEFFKKFPVKDIFWIRFLIFLSMTLSSFLFGLSFIRYWKIQLPFWVILSFIFVVQFVWAAPVQYVPNNSTLNQIVIYFSLASFFWGVNSDKKFKRNLGLLISGFFIGFVPLVMITNIPIIGALLLLLVILIPNQKVILPIIFYTIGILSLWVIYFVSIQTPESFFLSFSEARYYVNFIDSHGLTNILKWHYNTFVYMIGPPLVLLLLLLSFDFDLPKTKYSKVFLTGIGILVLGYVIFQEVFSPIAIFSSTLIYVLAVFSVVLFVETKRDFQKTSVLLFLLLVPYFAALGTDVAFQVRTSGYALPLALVILGVGNFNTNMFNSAFQGLVFVAFLTFLSYPFRTGWIGYKLSEQNSSLQLPNDAGQLKLSETVIKTHLKMSPYLHGKENVVVSDPKVLGYLYLSDASPIYLYFRLSDAYLFEYIESEKKDWEQLTFLEVKNKPFSTLIKSKIAELVTSGYHVEVSLENHIFYLPTNQ